MRTRRRHGVTMDRLWLVVCLLMAAVAYGQDAEPAEPEAVAPPAVTAALAELAAAEQPLTAAAIPEPTLGPVNAADRYRAAAASLPATPSTLITPYSDGGSWDGLDAASRRASADQILAGGAALAEALAGDPATGWWGWRTATPGQAAQDAVDVARLAEALADLAYIEARYGDRDRAFSFALHLHYLSRSFGQDYDWGAQLARLQLGRLASLALLDVLALHDPDYVQAETWIRELRAERTEQPMTLALTAELIYTAERAAAAASADAVLSAPARAELARYLEMDAGEPVHLPDREWDAALAARLQILATLRRICQQAHAMPEDERTSLMDALPETKLLPREAQIRVARDLDVDYDRHLVTAEAALIIRLYRLRTRTLPGSAEEAAKRLRIDWPANPVTGEPLAYHRVNDGECTTWLRDTAIGGDHPDAPEYLDVVYRHHRDLRSPDLAPTAPPAPSMTYDWALVALEMNEVPTTSAAIVDPYPAPKKNAAEYYVRAFDEYSAWLATHRALLRHMPYGGITPWADVDDATKRQLAAALLRDENADRLARYAANASRYPAYWRIARQSQTPPLAGKELRESCRHSVYWLASRALVSAHLDSPESAWADLGAALHLSQATATEMDFMMALDRLRQTRVCVDAIDAVSRIAHPDPQAAALLSQHLRDTREASLIGDLVRADIVASLATLDRDVRRRHLLAMRFLQSAEPQRRHAELELAALQYRIGPHFTFNQHGGLFTLYARIYGLSQLDPWTANAAFRDDRDLQDVPWLAEPALAMYTDLALQETALDARILMAETAIALRQYGVKNRELPEHLQSLVPDYMPALPRDPFDGSLLRYERLDTGFTLSSVGPDRTLQAADAADSDDIRFTASSSLAPRDSQRLRAAPANAP